MRFCPADHIRTPSHRRPVPSATETRLSGYPSTSKSFWVSLFMPSGKLFLHFSHPLHMILLLLPAAHTECVYIHSQSPGKHSFLTSHARLHSCNVSHSSCYNIPLRNLIASYIFSKLRVSGMPFTITVLGGADFDLTQILMRINYIEATPDEPSECPSVSRSTT